MAETPRTTLTDGTQVYPEHRKMKENGQQQDYVVLAESEREKGFVRPVRRSYKHLTCGSVTTMGSLSQRRMLGSRRSMAGRSAVVVAVIFRSVRMASLSGMEQTRKSGHDN